MRAEFDYGALIWVAFFVFSFAVSAIEKRNRAKKRNNNENSEPIPPADEAFPPVATQTLSDRIPKHIRQRIEEQRLGRTINHKDSQESLDSLETLGMPESLESIEQPFTATIRGKKAPKKAKTAPKSDPKPTTLEPQSATEQQTTSDTAERFNLRDAVIYSEILKPKFDE